MGFAPHKALDFAESLLTIGIGVAYKLLNIHSQDAAYLKLQTMAGMCKDNFQFWQLRL